MQNNANVIQEEVKRNEQLDGTGQIFDLNADKNDDGSQELSTSPKNEFEESVIIKAQNEG